MASLVSGGQLENDSARVWFLQTGNLVEPAAGALTFTGYAPNISFGVSGTLSGSETGQDTAAATGKVIVSGAATASETGADTAAATGRVITSGALSATESQDTASAAGSVRVSGSVSATETSDTATASGNVIVTGAAAASEQADTASGNAKLIVSGAFAATETGQDSVAASGFIPTTGVLACSEEGADSATGTGTLNTTFEITGAQALLIRRLHQLHGLAQPLTVSATDRTAGDLSQSITETTAGVTISTTAGHDTVSGSIGQMIEDLAALHGLTEELTVTATTRQAGSIVQSFVTSGTTTTVARQ
jgi:hypothetical protein